MKIDLIKAWKDEEYRSTLTKSQLKEISNPAGSIALSDADMENVNGGTSFTVGSSGSYNSGVGYNSIECCKQMF